MLQDEFLNYIKRLKNIADIGLLYAKDGYDTERYTEIREISLDLMGRMINEPITIVSNFYKTETDYPTPKVDIRAFVLNKKKQILLVKEKIDGLWSLPGGWADIGLTPSEVVAKEVKEETGLDVTPLSILAIFDKKCHPHPPEAHYIYKLIIHCEMYTTDISTGFDMLEAAFFDADRLPPLSTNRILESQIETIFSHFKSGNKETLFD
jgi:ADP-ribose pyrophosphatase YjhB (NUDIX family)